MIVLGRLYYLIGIHSDDSQVADRAVNAAGREGIILLLAQELPIIPGA